MVSAGDKGAPAGRGETPCGQRPIGQRGTFSSGLRYARASREADTRARTRREQRTPSPTTRGQRQGAGRGRLSGGGAVRVAATEPGPATGGHVRSQGRLQHRRVQPLGRGRVVAGTAHFNYWTLTENSLKRRQETQEEGAGRSPPVSGRGEESRAQAGPPRRSEQTRAPLRSAPTRHDPECRPGRTRHGDVASQLARLEPRARFHGVRWVRVLGREERPPKDTHVPGSPVPARSCADGRSAGAQTAGASRRPT